MCKSLELQERKDEKQLGNKKKGVPSHTGTNIQGVKNGCGRELVQCNTVQG